MALGSPLAFLLGGGPDPAQAAYDALRSAVGVGGSAEGGPRDTIVEAWRYARARGLAASDDVARAAVQVSPLLATDLISAYEQMTGAFSPAGAADQTRREATAAKWAEFVVAAEPTLLDRLRQIDPNAEISAVDLATTREVQHGRAFQDWDPSSPAASGPAFAMAQADPSMTQWPNYSSEFVLYVLLPTFAAGQVTATQARVMEQARQLLDEVLPAWVEFVVYGRGFGFILDVDLLDLTAFGS